MNFTQESPQRFRFNTKEKNKPVGLDQTEKFLHSKMCHHPNRHNAAWEKLLKEHTSNH